MRKITLRRFGKAAIAASAALALLFITPLGAAASEASTQQLWTTSIVVNKTSQSNVVGSQVLASCTVAVAGATCTITSGKTATRTIAYTFGATREGVATSLNISAASSVTLSVSCTSPPLSAGGSWRAKPRGTKYTYKIRELTYVDAIIVSQRDSAYLNAYNPTANAIYCY
jgi:hypothetical protein